MRYEMTAPGRMMARAGTQAALWLCLPGALLAQVPEDTQALRDESAQTVSQSEAPTDPAPGLFEMLGRITYFTGRLLRPVLEVPASVTVVDGQDLQDQAVTDMQQLTRYVPGLSVNRQINAAQPFNDFDGFSMRGVGGNRVLMLVDGSRVAERITDGTRDYLDFSFVRQAEVVGGPASVVWGADALGGVVALRTVTPDDILQGRERGAELRSSYDSFTNTSTVTGTFAQQLSERLSMLIGYSHLRANEPRLSNAAPNGGLYSDIHGGCPRDLAAGATPCNEFDPTDIEMHHGLVRFDFRPNDEHRFGFTADLMRRVTALDFNQNLGNTSSASTYVMSDHRVQTISRQRFALDHEWTPGGGFLDQLTTTLAFVPHSYERTGERRSITGGETSVQYDTLNLYEDFFELDIQGVRRFAVGGAQHELTFGFDGDHTTTDYQRLTRVVNLTTGSDVTTRAGGFNFANATTRRADLYLQDRITWADGRFELTPGLRYATYVIDPRPDPDYVVVPGSEPQRRQDQALLGSLGARWRVNNQWTIWGNVGQGFKMPTAEQLYTSLDGNGFDLIPAPNLRPEFVTSLEIGARGEFADGYVSVSAYRANYTDFIQSFYNPPGTDDYTYRNIEEREVWGIELAGEYQITPDLTLTGSLAWQRGRQRVDPASAETAANLRPLRGVVGLSWEVPNSRLTLDAYSRFASGVRETASADGFRPAGYALLDLYARYALTDQAAITFGITNLFDTAYYEDSAIGATTNPSLAVARQNPLDLRMGAGRVFTLALETRF